MGFDIYVTLIKEQIIRLKEVDIFLRSIIYITKTFIPTINIL